MFFKRLLSTVLPILLVLSMVLTSCVSTDNPVPGTDAGTETHSHETEAGTTPPTTPPSGGGNEGGNEGGDNNDPPAPPAPCTHAQTELKNVRAATCGQKGYTGDSVCTACGVTVSTGSETEKLPHTLWDEGRVTKTPTCISTGVMTFTCMGCGEIKTETLEQVAHDPQYHDQHDGTHTITCSNCTHNESEAHTPVDAGTYYPATCLEGAYTILTCSKCELQYKEYSTTELKLDHDWDEEHPVIVKPTCVDDGYQYMTCKHEGCDAHSAKVVLPATPNVHSFDYDYPINSTDPYCTTAGSKTYMCGFCQATETKTVASLGHNYISDEPTDDGWTHQHCERCGDEISHFDASNVKETNVTTSNIDTTKPFEVKLETADIQFPVEVIEQMKEAAGDVTIKADVVKDTAKDALVEKAQEALDNAAENALDEEDLEALKNSEVYDFGVLVAGGDTGVGSFNSAVTVTLPYTLKVTDEATGEREDPDGIVIWFVNDETGEAEKIENVVFRDEDGDGVGTVSFEAAHFSCYAVAYRETPEMRCRRGKHEHTVVLETVEVSCYSAGYTTKKCKYCDDVTVDDLQAPLGHNWDSVEHMPVVDCTNGGYSYNLCQNENCNEKRELKYYAPTGHRIENVATCEDAAICTVCNKIAVPAKGHDWDEWIVIMEPTEINSGLRRRYCLSCGNVDEVRLAATGNIKEWEIESYQELFELLFSEVLNFGNGTISFVADMQGTQYKFNVTVNEEGDSYLALMEVEFPNNYGELEKFTFVYRNGVMISKPDQYYEMDMGALAVLPIQTLLTYLEQAFDAINPYAEEGLAQLRLMLDEYTKLYGTRVDAFLELAGSEYRMAELSEVLNSMETVYTYLALKMGFETNLGIHDGVELPTKADWHNVFAAMTEAVEADGNKTYTLTLEPLMTSIDATLTWFEENAEKNMGELLYMAIVAIGGEEFTTAYPELTDWTATYNYFTQQFHGELQVKDVVDGLLTFIDQSGVCTLEELYALIDELVIASGLTEGMPEGEEFSTEAFVLAYSELTLDEVAEMFMGEGATVAAIYDDLNDMLTGMILGELVIPSVGGENTPDDNGKDDDYDDGFSEDFVDKDGDGKPDNMQGGISTPEIGGVIQDAVMTAGEGLEIENETTDNGFGDMLPLPSEPVEDGNVEENIPSEDEKVEDGSTSTEDGKEDVPTEDDNEDIPNDDENAEGGEGEAEGDAVTVNDVVKDLRDMLASFNVDLSFEVTLDAEGNLISMKLGQSFALVEGEDKMPIESVTLEIKQDDNAKVTLPDDLNAASGNKIDYSYDQSGNLVINGLPANGEFDFKVEGNLSIDLTQHLTRDEAMSEKLGYDVYVLAREYWTDYESVNGEKNTPYVMGKDGKLYSAVMSYQSSYLKAVEFAKLADVLANPNNYLPDTSKTTRDYYQYSKNGTTKLIPVYQTVLGLPAYQLDGEWYLLNSTNWGGNYVTDAETGERYMQRVYYSGTSAPLLAAIRSMSLSSMDFNNYNTILDATTGKALENVRAAYFYMDGFNGTVKLSVQINGNEINLIKTEYVGSREILTVGDEITNVPAYDFYEKNNWSDLIIQLADGTVTNDYTQVSLYVMVPTYYVIYDGHYFELFSNEMSATTREIQNTVILPDEREFYVTMETAFGAYEDVLVGYFKTHTGYFVQAACLYSMGELVDVVYRYGTEKYDQVSPYHMIDMDDYVTKNANGSYTVKAELFTKLNALCTQPADLYFIAVGGTYKIGNLNCEVEYMLDGAWAEMNIVSFLAGLMEDADLNWSKWFGNGHGDVEKSNFETRVNDDGTLSIIVDGDRVASYSIGFRGNDFIDNFDADDVMVENEKLSEQYGVPVYTVTRYNTSNTYYYLIDGKYYNLSWNEDRIVTDAREMTLAELFGNWTVRNLSLNYDTQDGNLPVYRGDVVWNNASNKYGMFEYSMPNRFFTVENGTLYILTGVEETGNSLLSYEGKMKMSEYFASLSYAPYGTDSKTNYYLADGTTAIYRVEMRIMEGDKQIGYAYVPCYLKGEEKQYLVIDGYTTRYTVTAQYETTLPEGWQTVAQVPFVAANGTYTRVYGVYTSKYENHYVKIADHYYNLGDVTYRWVDEDKFEDTTENREYRFYVINPDGSVTRYESYKVMGDGTYEMYNELEFYERISEFEAQKAMLGLGKGTVMGATADGGEVLEFVVASEGPEMLEWTFDDGCVFYYTEDSREGYVKLANNKYLRAYLMEQNGEFVVYPYDFYEDSMYRPNGADLLYRQGIQDCIEINGNEMIISAEILDLLEAYGDSVYIEVRENYLYTYENGAYVEYTWIGQIRLADLLTWFASVEENAD